MSRLAQFLLTLGALLSAPVPAAAAEGLTLRGGADPRIQQGIDLIYQLRFAEADLYFETIIAEDPANPTGHFFLAMVGWWRVLIDLDDRSHDEELYALLQSCIDAPEDVKCDIFFATSGNKWGYRDISHAKEALGWVPSDSADSHYED